MNKKIFVVVFSLTAMLMVCGVASAQTTVASAQTTMDSLIERVSAVSIESKTPFEILQQLIQEGELDSAVPKGTIIQDDRTETIFVFELLGDPDEDFQDFQNYFIKEENFQMIDNKEEGEIKAVELSKGASTIVLVKRGSVMVESRQENTVILPEAPAVDGGTEGILGTGGVPSWIWLVIAGVIVLIVLIFLIKKLASKKKK